MRKDGKEGGCGEGGGRQEGEWIKEEGGGEREHTQEKLGFQTGIPPLCTVFVFLATLQARASYGETEVKATG